MCLYHTYLSKKGSYGASMSFYWAFSRKTIPWTHNIGILSKSNRWKLKKIIKPGKPPLKIAQKRTLTILRFDK